MSPAVSHGRETLAGFVPGINLGISSVWHGQKIACPQAKPKSSLTNENAEILLGVLRARPFKRMSVRKRWEKQ